MKSITIQFFADPCHGWAKVKRSHPVFRKVAHEISHSSYQKGEWVFLEEDSDFGTFYLQLQLEGYDVKIVENVSMVRMSRIRSYDNYCASTTLS
jgi:hypothetical protein